MKRLHRDIKAALDAECQASGVAPGRLDLDGRHPGYVVRVRNVEKRVPFSGSPKDLESCVNSSVQALRRAIRSLIA